jgi:hypothetical protein
LPAPPLRTNRATWAVPIGRLPAVSHVLHDVLPNEPYDPHWQGQDLWTTYLDTPGFALRRARRKGDRYLTLRLRCYRGETYALSAKTEGAKWRREVAPAQAEAILAGADPTWPDALLPAHLQARLLDLADGADLGPVAAVCCRRYAVEDDQDRLTLDVDVRTDAGKALPFAVLEFKSADPDAGPPSLLGGLCLWPIKLSKFLWATEV